MTFDIYPAIDLRHGRVVRLERGDPARQTVFGHDPAATGRRWVEAGAAWLHVVNLDGALAEAGADNWAALDRLANLGARVQFGGGLRAMADIEAALELGVSRVLLGTAALENPQLVAEALARYGPARVAVSIDARDGRVHTRGWQTQTAVAPLDLALAMRDAGVEVVTYTDISRDGVLTGVNVEATAELAHASGLDVIASGGVNSLDDIARLGAVAAGRGSGVGRVAGVIIGRALYDGKLDLADALTVARDSYPASS
ncbi:1-(5-phosphoribosyl)-5-[(5-phosphoribosylamino)methylideneamino]imidazole-4-carboxamide isomerase [Promineifilum sp.]|uniref:1-(5-phosphoribosyl)-5-[(5- phosphoribosylamino)methylideneamino]imidazole-4- carboxamide isomerase n=1 Tax=Promineifilum sp. TaxID=2664178 RepID=UPI0035B0CAAD